jgi:antitoxin component YwqK of YwqJK toxin-antitoxin module
MTKDLFEHKVKYYSNGNIDFEMYLKNGRLHRDGDLPAVIHYLDTGTMYSEEYYIDGQYHRERGYAFIRYSTVLSKKITKHFLYGIEIHRTKKVKYLTEFKKFKELSINDKTLIILNYKHENPLIQHYCQKELYVTQL